MERAIELELKEKLDFSCPWLWSTSPTLQTWKRLQKRSWCAVDFFLELYYYNCNKECAIKCSDCKTDISTFFTLLYLPFLGFSRQKNEEHLTCFFAWGPSTSDSLFLSKQKYSNMYNDNIFFTLVYLVLQHLNKDATFQMHLFRCQSITYCTTSQYIVHFISFKKACCVLILATFRTWKKSL